ncbi:MAG: tripartite tricarboxylate transporter substrate binding protein [Betaproteobacteria bacterium]|nr:tripartite tricarboxylate transporter substrate binding protein [Betaproteobacteria bacterium]
MKQMIFLTIALYIVVSGGGAAHAQDYPTKPVRFVLGLAPGGSTDVVARTVAQKLSETWGQNVLVDNRPGAGGTIGANLVVNAQPDGYTLFVGGFGPNAMAPSLYSKLPYDPYKDFAHVTLMVTLPLAMIVPASSPVAGLKELIEQAKSKPGMLRYGSVGVGSSPHVFIELMNLRAEISTVHVPYKGGPAALTGVLASEVDYAMTSISTALTQLGAGRIRAIAVTSANASPRLPGVPPISSVLPGYEGLEFHGLHAPAKTPKQIVATLQRDVANVLRRPEVKERLDGLAMDIQASTPEECTAFIRKQIDTWTAVARKANVRAD